jgi:hypothetical protein
MHNSGGAVGSSVFHLGSYPGSQRGSWIMKVPFGKQKKIVDLLIMRFVLLD